MLPTGPCDRTMDFGRDHTEFEHSVYRRNSCKRGAASFAVCTSRHAVGCSMGGIVRAVPGGAVIVRNRIAQFDLVATEEQTQVAAAGSPGNTDSKPAAEESG